MKPYFFFIFYAVSCLSPALPQSLGSKNLVPGLSAANAVTITNTFNADERWYLCSIGRTDYWQAFDFIGTKVVLPVESEYVELRQNNNLNPNPVFWCQAKKEYTIDGKDGKAGYALMSCPDEIAENEVRFFVLMADSLHLRSSLMEEIKQFSALLKRGVYSQKSKKEYDHKLGYLQAYAKRHPVSPLFEELIRTSFYSEYINKLMTVVGLKKEPSRTDSLSSIVLAAKSKVLNEKLLFSFDYRRFLQSYSYFFAKNEYKKDSVGINEWYNLTKEQFHGKVRDYLLFYITTTSLREYQDASFVSKFENDCADTTYTNYIRDNSTVKNQLATLVKDTLLTTRLEKISLQDAIKRHKGKLVYVDFWASWCAPCREMMVKSKKLHEKYKDKVVFLYISIDKDFSAWKRASGEEQIADNRSFWISADADFVKKQAIKSIPRYVLIGRNGEILNSNAPRPDDKDWNAQILKY